MDATGLWFSKLESNFYADYGQFRWTEEQRTWDWDNLTTVDLVSTKDGTKRLVLRRKGRIHTKDGRPDIAEQDGYDASLRYMIGIDIDDEPGDIKCDYYTARVYDHFENRWNLIGRRGESHSKLLITLGYGNGQMKNASRQVLLRAQKLERYMSI